MNYLGPILLGIMIWAASAPASEMPSGMSLGGTWKVLSGDLAPANAYQPDVDDTSWATLRVPGNWHLQGKDMSGVVWHRTHFAVTELPAGQLAKLTFEGVDYAADVWINGHYVGYHEGYFEPFSFYVQSYLECGDNLLVVRVNSPNETPEAWSLHKRLIKGVLNHHDTRPGGAWSIRGQEQNTGGIWGDVTLRVLSKVDISSVHITTRPDEDGAWLAEIAAQISPVGPKDVSINNIAISECFKAYWS